MTLVTLVSVAVVVFVLLRSHPTRRRTTAAVGAAVGLANPLAGAGLALAWFFA